MDNKCKKCKGTGKVLDRIIPFAGGSMGMGLAAGVGFAISKKLKGEKGMVYVFESDGGMNVGINWEAATIASHHKLDNLILIIEKNGFQAMGKTEEVLNMDNLDERLRSFGWETGTIDGHNFQHIQTALDYPKYSEKPRAIIAKTIKGKGIDFMENVNLWHYAKVQEEDYKKAMLCLK